MTISEHPDFECFILELIWDLRALSADNKTANSLNSFPTQYLKSWKRELKSLVLCWWWMEFNCGVLTSNRSNN
jgi:hypothetical protein